MKLRPHVVGNTCWLNPLALLVGSWHQFFPREREREKEALKRRCFLFPRLKFNRKFQSEAPPPSLLSLPRELSPSTNQPTTAEKKGQFEIFWNPIRWKSWLAASGFRLSLSLWFYALSLSQAKKLCLCFSFSLWAGEMEGREIRVDLTNIH